MESFVLRDVNRKRSQAIRSDQVLCFCHQEGKSSRLLSQSSWRLLLAIQTLLQGVLFNSALRCLTLQRDTTPFCGRLRKLL
jgi:hypothetical protein